MNRNLYTLAIFITASYFLIASLQCFFSIQLGGRMYIAKSSEAWYLFGVTMSTLASVLALKCFHYKQYRRTFLALLIATLIFLFHSIFIYILWLAAALGTYNNISALLVYATGILYAISLIFSIAGKRAWLRAAGIFVLAHQAISLSVAVLFFDIRGCERIGPVGKD